MIISSRQRVDVYRATVREASELPFAYGSNDCMLMIANAVSRLIGVDHSIEFMPYTALRALLMIERAGGMVPFVSRFLGHPEESLDGIRICDPVVIKNGDLEAGGLWNGTSVTALKEGGSIVLVSREYVIASWRIG